MSIDILATGVVTIVAAATGWLLNELSSWFKLQQEDRADGLAITYTVMRWHSITFNGAQ